jgi:hypothetical protein
MERGLTAARADLARAFIIKTVFILFSLRRKQAKLIFWVPLCTPNVDFEKSKKKRKTIFERGIQR